jgi:hypothetical protein
LHAAAERFDFTLLAEPFAPDLQPRLWPGVKVVPFTAPWTAFSITSIINDLTQRIPAWEKCHRLDFSSLPTFASISVSELQMS